MMKFSKKEFRSQKRHLPK